MELALVFTAVVFGGFGILAWIADTCEGRMIEWIEAAHELLVGEVNE
jgi:hypothetical protein